MGSPVEPYFDGESWWYSKRTWQHAQQTKERAARKRREQELREEVARLRHLGADEAWIARVTALAAEGGTR